MRSLTLDEWVGLLEGTGLLVETVELFPKRHDFADWTSRSGVPESDRAGIASILCSAGPSAVEAFQLEIEATTLIAFTDNKALLRGKVKEGV